MRKGAKPLRRLNLDRKERETFPLMRRRRGAVQTHPVPLTSSLSTPTTPTMTTTTSMMTAMGMTESFEIPPPFLSATPLSRPSKAWSRTLLVWSTSRINSTRRGGRRVQGSLPAGGQGVKGRGEGGGRGRGRESGSLVRSGVGVANQENRYNH